MYFVFDIGNSSIGCAAFEGTEMVVRRRMDTDPQRSWKAYTEDLRGMLDDAGIAGGAPEGAIVSSVVRGMSAVIGQAVQALWGLVLIEARAEADPGIEVAVPRPEAVGIDRLLAAGEGFRLVGGPVVVVDLGTAVTVDLVSAAGCFMGGTIGPGLKTMLRSLATETSLLPEVEIEAPVSVLGQETQACIRAGVVLGTAGGVDRLIAELSEVASETPLVLLTGGDAAFLSAYLKIPHRVEADLVLRGLASAYQRRRRAQ